MNKEILDFYKQTSLYTDLGLYKTFAKNLTNDINELCLLQRKQIIHPFEFDRNSIFYTENQNDNIPVYYKKFEDDLFPTAISMIAELLRRDKHYNYNRKTKDKLHVTCRGQALLLTSILKAKGIPARVRSGFAYYTSEIKDVADDHCIVEYYNKKEKRWILVDPDMHDYDDNLTINVNDLNPKDYVFAAEAYLKIRKGEYKEKNIYYASTPYEYGLKAAIRILHYDFNNLMNNEIFYTHLPQYLIDNKLILNEKELKELDILANLMLNPNENFYKLKNIWETNDKYRKIKRGFSQ